MGVETLVFAGSTVLTRADLAARVLAAESTSGADTIKGFSSDDFLLGASGNDVSAFGETAFGADVIGDFNGLQDRIAFDEDIVQDFDALMLSAARDGLDVLITTGTGSVRLLNTDLVRPDSDIFIFS